MQTLTTVLVATAITLAIGLLFGILSARSDRVRATLRPMLDAAQTMPAFVYLIPAVALFGPTRFTAIVASVIYADAGRHPAGRRRDPRGLADHHGSRDRRRLDRPPAALEGPAAAVAPRAAGRGQPGHRAGPRHGRRRRAGRRRGARLRRHRRVRPATRTSARGSPRVSRSSLLGIMLDRITQGVGGRKPIDVAEGA